MPMSFSQYTKAEEDHAEQAVDFADYCDEYQTKNNLSIEQMIVLLNDTIKYYEIYKQG